MKISIIGTGYVGLVTGACFAELGNQVICVDNDTAKVASLKRIQLPIYEPGLEDIVKRNYKEKRLLFSSSIKDAVEKSEVIFIAVGTPPKLNGEADLTGIENVAQSIAKNLKEYRLIVEKSTVPVDTGNWVEHTIKVNLKKKVTFDVASNPEFLREGSAVSDFMKPDRIVVGVKSKRAEKILRDLYGPIKSPLVVTDINSAELIKHASNSFLAMKISFINAVAQVCEKTGADVVKVANGMGLDKRIGKGFLDAGVGFGGSCFPKDVDAFVNISGKLGYDFQLLKIVRDINREQRDFLIEKIKKTLWIIKDKRIAILGLAFKPNTDDIREAPALEVIETLKIEGAKINVFDPQAMDKAKKVLKGVKFCKDVYSAAKNCDCLVVITDWNEFKELDFKRLKRIMKQRIIVDGRNIYDSEKLKTLGFRYSGIGRNHNA